MPDRVLRLAVLGCGWFGREAHLANLVRMEDVEVVAASSRSAENRQKAAEIAPQARLFEDWRSVIELPEVDAVVIALPNHLHAEAAVAALNAGKHVLCEKPLGRTVAECNAVIDAAKRAGRVLQVGHELRFQRLYVEAKRLVDSGAVGQPRMMWCQEFRGPMRTGWRASEDLTGGMLVEKNCHHFDLFNWFLGTPLRVAAFGGRDVLKDREILDNAVVIVEHKGGTRATLQVALFAPGGGDVEVGVLGTRGRLDTWNQESRLMLNTFDTHDHMDMLVGDWPEEVAFVDVAGLANRGILPELKEFVRCCRTGQRPTVDGEVGRMSVAVAQAAQESIHQGRVISIEELL